MLPLAGTLKLVKKQKKIVHGSAILNTYLILFALTLSTTGSGILLMKSYESINHQSSIGLYMLHFPVFEKRSHPTSKT